MLNKIKKAKTFEELQAAFATAMGIKAIPPNIDLENAAVATTEQILEGKISGVRFDRELPNEAEAGYPTGKVRVGPKFFRLTGAERKHVLRHEIAHYFAEEIGVENSVRLAKAGVFGPLDQNGRIMRGINGNFIPDENMTEALTVFQEEPEWLKEHFPKAYIVVKSFFETGKLPKEFDEWAKQARQKQEQEEAREEGALSQIRANIQNAQTDQEKAKWQKALRQVFIEGDSAYTVLADFNGS